MRISFLFLASAALLATACNAEKGAANSSGPEVTAKPVPAPNNGDWSTIVSATPEGGFVMGNPNAKVKLVEFGSLTCPHWAEFEEKGGKALVDNYVKKGLVSGAERAVHSVRWQRRHSTGPERWRGLGQSPSTCS